MRKLEDFDVNGINFKKEKMNSFFEELDSKWKSDFWKLPELIKLEENFESPAIGFSIDNHINKEIKYSLSLIFNSKSNWSKMSLRPYLYCIHALISYINSLSEKLPSLLVLSEDNKLNELMNYLSFKKYSKTTQKLTKLDLRQVFGHTKVYFFVLRNLHF